MKISVHAVGRMKAGPEKLLADRYFERFAKSGPAVGLEFGGIAEIAEGRSQTANERRREEGQKLQTQLHPGTALVLLDERGKSFSSEDFAGRLGLLRDGGRKALVIAIGGADGHDHSLRDQAELVMSFGLLTWPHQLVRVMLGEQLYRVATILSGHPYHRS
ncbi:MULTISPECIES: 23S rRNA (pseudouridine(1915)-N(3))-methyltransferase RlmH [unclassified Mesorhizobium]|uniref:23S rRNA (pseudouridine(1915)-N(3))-methyltransferase RlmH n=1 Tax=unclassified Mesorhizobium TaxID=325217 RepID=UPI000FCB81BB|nr:MULTISPECIES: 23S rRNA (pseudouridine(1915)-N(3))-methyltransferase RlmH [unclassified Mesorhizobium]RUU66638.1 23S rRNA (pseudouridine(1915)-N(3))-methyltransferase RlmH [Mesorhizobium sp. M7A.T.Ca.TU.009.01.1.1]RUU88521.1 23S rRNA (pseudouridine(1915)-N(3))-methyltransferase RlmH [Mesorhizobium sp. M7A.T.Ca.TU.009.01.1.2]RUT83824.1 23S rRNA (pseudouridine(1915)-N(3))-methyltransferase RlmH [Mesorhizobium sp. M7A.T.Ca.US.000.02.1.1]RUT94832.1 23S rRNA (pseudouridine(1915)-N(3))-methyltransf